jgi:hypothetical protein
MAGDFNPADHSVAEVNEYLESADADETARVLAAESATEKPRKGILEGPHAAGEGDSDGSPEVVLVAFAYASAKNGEVVQLLKGDIIDANRYTEKSLEHLRSIGFIGKQD